MELTKALLISTILILVGTIIILITLLIPQPAVKEEALNFTSVIKLASKAISKVSFIRIVYDVNITDEHNKTHEGTMVYRNENRSETVIISESINPYYGTAVLPTPLEAFNYIQENKQGNYGNKSRPQGRECYSTYSIPVNVTNRYNQGGQLFYMACMDVETGYPTMLVIRDFNDTQRLNSIIFLRTMTFKR